jgi:uncharacterized phiE125 gp8 family phage protein
MAVTTANVKSAMRIDYTDDDTLISSLISHVTDFVERYCGFALSSATRTMKLTSFNRSVFSVVPFASLTSVTYTNLAGSTVTMTSGVDYWLDDSDELAALVFLNTPEMKAGTLATVTYVAGYTTYPPAVDQVIISIVGAHYNNPEAAQPISLSTVPLGAQFMLEHLRMRGPFR